MIQREETDWGVRLVDKPFTSPVENAEMYIQADIMRPQSKSSRAEVAFWFSGTTVQRPLRAADVIIWREHLNAVCDAAREEALMMKQPEGGKRKAKK
jgi:hypothetical protein